MNILYIEDDIIDIKSFQLIFSKHTNHTITIAENFVTAIDIINNNQIDFVISDGSIGMDTFLDYWYEFFGLPYFVLSNQPNPEIFNLSQPPVGVYQKPIQKTQLDEILSSVNLVNQEPNLSYAENISGGDPTIIKEILDILIQQFQDAIDKIPYLYENKQQEELIQIIHKLIGKFSVLSMKDSFSFFNLVEKYLREGFELKTFAFNRILTDLKMGINFMKKYIEINELHNS